VCKIKGSPRALFISKKGRRAHPVWRLVDKDYSPTWNAKAAK
jgi:hypothetical protein